VPDSGGHKLITGQFVKFLIKPWAIKMPGEAYIMTGANEGQEPIWNDPNNPPEGAVIFPVVYPDFVPTRMPVLGETIDYEALGLFLHRGYGDGYGAEDPMFANSYHPGDDITAWAPNSSQQVFDEDGNLIPQERYGLTGGADGLNVVMPSSDAMVMYANDGLFGQTIIIRVPADVDGDGVNEDVYIRFMHTDTSMTGLPELLLYQDEYAAYHASTFSTRTDWPMGSTVAYVMEDDRPNSRGTHVHMDICVVEAGQSCILNASPQFYGFNDGNGQNDGRIEQDELSVFSDPASVPFVYWYEPVPGQGQWVALTQSAADLMQRDQSQLVSQTVEPMNYLGADVPGSLVTITSFNRNAALLSELDDAARTAVGGIISDGLILADELANYGINGEDAMSLMQNIRNYAGDAVDANEIEQVALMMGQAAMRGRGGI
jgi:hypothetical protein